MEGATRPGRPVPGGSGESSFDVCSKERSRGFDIAFRRRPAAAPARVYKQSVLAPAPPVSPWAAPAAVPRRASGPEPGRALWGPGLRDGERGGGRGRWRGSLFPPQASLSSQPHTAPLLQGPGFLPLYNKLRNLQRLLGRRTRGSQVRDFMSLVRTAAIGQVAKAGSTIIAPWSHIYRVRMATG